VFHDSKPMSLKSLDLKIAQWDYDFEQTVLANNETKFEFEQNTNGVWSTVEYKDEKNPRKNWAVPYVTGHRYRIHWGESPDFEEINL
jgi:hypothetical protein